MKRNHVYVSSAIVCLLSALVLLALAAPVSVTPSNIVLKDGSGAITVTSVYCGVLSNYTSDGYVQVYRMLVENGSSFPAVASSGFLFLRTDWNVLTFYNGTDWTNCTGGGVSGGPYLLASEATNLLFTNGTQPLTANWNTGAFGVYGCTWVNSTSFDALGYYWNGLNRTDAVANPIGPCSYIIDVSGSSYRMKNGSTGQFDFVSTNASAVINNAIGNLTSGTIFVFNGTYTLTNTILLKGKVLVRGAGMFSTIFQIGINANCNAFNWTPSGTEQMAGLFDCQISGDKTHNVGGVGVYMSGETWDFMCERVWIYDMDQQGMYVLNKLWGHKYYDLIIETCGNHGFYTAASGPASFVGCRFASNTGKGFYGWVSDLTFSGCEFDSNTDDGINIGDGSYGVSILGGRFAFNSGDGVDIRGDRIRLTSTYLKENTGYGVYLGTTAEHNSVVGNNFYGNVAGAVLDSGTSNLVVHNVGYTSQWDISQISTITIGENVTVGDVIFHNSTGYFRALATSSATLPTYGVYGIALETNSSGSCLVMTSGQFTYASWNWDVSLPLYVSNSTFGGMQQTYPSASGQQSEIVAQAISNTTILFNPKSVISIP